MLRIIFQSLLSCHKSQVDAGLEVIHGHSQTLGRLGRGHFEDCRKVTLPLLDLTRFVVIPQIYYLGWSSQWVLGDICVDLLADLWKMFVES